MLRHTHAFKPNIVEWMSSSTILIICGFNMWVLSQIIHEIITDIICHSDFFLESVRSTKLVLWLQVMKWVLKYFTLAPHLIFFFSHLAKNVRKIILRWTQYVRKITAQRLYNIKANIIMLIQMSLLCYGNSCKPLLTFNQMEV